MVWCGGAEQQLAFKCFYINVGKIDLHQTKNMGKNKKKAGKIMTMISKLTTKAGTTVTKFLEKQPMREGYGRVKKVIEYAPNSKLSQLGIDKVVIRNAGNEGKHIMAFKGDKCVVLGKTKPAWKLEQSVSSQFKEFVAAAKKFFGK